MRKNSFLLLLTIALILFSLIIFTKNVFADFENPEKIIAVSDNNFKFDYPLKIKISKLIKRTCYVIEIRNLDKYIFLESKFTNTYNNDCAQFARKKGLHPYFVFDTHDTGVTEHEFLIDDENDLKNLIPGKYQIILNKKIAASITFDYFKQVDEYIINIIKPDQNQPSTPTPQPPVAPNIECETPTGTKATSGQGLTYRATNKYATGTFYFGRSWELNNNNPENVIFDNGVLIHNFSAPTQPGNYRVFINSDKDLLKKGQGYCFMDFTVESLPPGTPIPTEITRNTPIPQITQSPELITNCPICPEKYWWSQAYNKCENENNIIDPISYVDCSSTNVCLSGVGCSSNEPKEGSWKDVCELQQDCKNINECTTDYVCHTAVGDVVASADGFVKWLFGLILGLSGGIALLLIIYSGYKLMLSRGNPEKIQGAKETLTSTIVGLMFILFSMVILELLGVDILGIFPK